jgi:MoxR-like ATPase
VPSIEAESVLITGVYGAGKSSVAEEIAVALEARAVRFGAIDLAWLMWFAVPDVEPSECGGWSLSFNGLAGS